MNRRSKMIVGAAVGLAVIGGGAAAVAASGIVDNEAPITGEALSKASDAALKHTQGGKVTDTEVGDEESLYEVEVTLPDGSEVDVQLDNNFDVVGSESDANEQDETT